MVHSEGDCELKNIFFACWQKKNPSTNVDGQVKYFVLSIFRKHI